MHFIFILNNSIWVLLAELGARSLYIVRFKLHLFAGVLSTQTHRPQKPSSSAHYSRSKLWLFSSFSNIG